jgi:hypothetical protein
MPGRARHTLPGQTHKACLRRTNTPPRQGGGGPDTQSLFAEDQHPSPSRRKGTPVKRLQYHRGPIAGHTIPKLPRAKTRSPSKENETPGTGDLEGRGVAWTHDARWRWATPSRQRRMRLPVPVILKGGLHYTPLASLSFHESVCVAFNLNESLCMAC